MNNANEPINPLKVFQYKVGHSFGGEDHQYRGLTKREYFAAMAMQGLLASWGQHDVTEFSEIAHDAVSAADALLCALNSQQSNTP